MTEKPTSKRSLASEILELLPISLNGSESNVGNCPAGERQFCNPPCLFERALLSPVDRESCPGMERLASLVQSGVTLRSQWERPWRLVADSWLGRRLYLSHSCNFLPSRKFVAVVSSQIGRHGRKLPLWPDLLDAALRNASIANSRLLLVPGTTLFEAARDFGETADLEHVLVDVCTTETAIETWLDRQLKQFDQDSNWLDNRICVSPVIEPSPSQTSPSLAAPPTMPAAPLQDRLSFALADTVYVLSRRPGGNIDRLVQARLSTEEFPLGSLFVNVGRDSVQITKCASKPAFEQQAVGWYVARSDLRVYANLSPCRRATLDSQEALRCQVGDCQPNQARHVRQLAARLPDWSSSQASSPAYFVHCTRGNSGPLPDEKEADYLLRVWIAGHVAENHPLLTLNAICQEGILRGNSGITRSGKSCVSFSAVTLPELLERRKFRSHLGRWDWEPYGILLSRRALAEVGARPVIYGTEAVYDALNEADQPFFQPLGTDKTQWIEEQEWRLLGDLRLNQLPLDDIRLFVRTREEALRLADRFPWPVFWVES